MNHYEHPLFKEWELLCKKSIKIHKEEGFTEEYHKIRSEMIRIAEKIFESL